MQQVCRWQDDDCRLDVVVIDATSGMAGGRPAYDGVDDAAADGGIHHGRPPAASAWRLGGHFTTPTDVILMRWIVYSTAGVMVGYV